MKKWLGVFISLFFIVLLYSKVSQENWAAAYNSLDGVNYMYLTGGISLLALAIYVQSQRWKLLLTPLGRFSNSDAFSSVIIGNWFNVVLPLRFGEIVRPYHFSKKHNLPFTTLLVAAFFDKVFDAMALLLVTMLCLKMLFFADADIGTTLLSLFVFLFSAALLLLLLKQRKLLLGIVQRVPFERPRKHLYAIADGIISGVDLVHSFRQLCILILYTLLVWCCDILGYWLIINACHLPEQLKSFNAGILTRCASSIGHNMPSVAGGLGTINYSVVVVLEQYARSIAFNYLQYSPQILSSSLIIYLASVAPDVFIGGYCYWKDRALLSVFRLKEI
jgi:uncharacterized protein (TIRG00374 family)